jgi:RHH-type proline utilization regulon transcriptional repressor/proline dehydrogenase/delta 1-pyrroline-5-carboxylate dehydrogenase
MAEPVRTALRKAGCPLRLYVPIGEMIPGMAYLVRRLLENTANESFLRQSFAQEVDRDELLRNPLELLAPEPRGQPAAARESRPSPAARGDAPPFHNEPPLNWTLRDNREGFARALADVRRQFPFEHPLVIGGQRVTSGREIPSSDPNQPDRLIGVVAAASAAEVEAAVAAARDAFPSWRATAPQIRASCLLRAAQAARRRRLELAALQVYEVGKNWSEADADVCEAIDFLEYYAREMLRLAEPRQLGPIPGEVSRLLYEPRGVAAVISPWNFPLAISAGMASAAIVTGNTVVYKPASASPVSGYALYQIFEEAGVPPGVVNFLPGSGAEVGDRLTGHPDVDLIAFTGSREVGLRILEIAHRVSPGMRNVRQVIAEMGGKNAIIVDADADLDEAVVHILQSAFGYQGQKCSACSRLIVLEAIYDRLVERLLAAARSIHLGPADDPRTLLGAVIDAAARDKVEYFAALGERDGTLLLERPLRGVPGHGTALRVYTDVDSQAAVAQEEIFGPLLVILRVRDFEEALAVANNTRYALTGALFSRSPGNVDKAGRALRVGNLYVNRGCTGAIVGRHPFGGFKLSGTGSKAGGPDYLQQFMVVRNVVENTVRRGFAPSMPAAPEGD